MTVFYARLGLIAIIPMRYMHEKPLLLKDLLRGVIPSDIAVRYRKEREKKTRTEKPIHRMASRSEAISIQCLQHESLS